MRALVCNRYGPPETLDIEEVEDPAPGENQVLVDIAAAGLNFPDMLMIAGRYQVKIPPPFIPGFEFAGTVAAVGSNVDNVEVGQRVMATSISGALAEKTVVDASAVAPVPPELSFEQAAGFLITYSTSYHALVQCADIQADDTMLVLGAAGGVGTTAVEIGHAAGARVIAAASSEDKLEFARAAGADETLNYTESSLRDVVASLTDGEGVDIVYDPVGGELGLDALKSLAWEGRYLVIGFASGDIPSFPANLALLKAARIIGVYWGDWAKKNPGQQAQNLAEMAKLVADGKLSASVSETYPLTDFEQAFRAIRERRALGKVVVTMSGA